MIIVSPPVPIGLGFGFWTPLGLSLGLRGLDLGLGLDNNVGFIFTVIGYTIIVHWDSIIDFPHYFSLFSLRLVEEPLHAQNRRLPVPLCHSFLYNKFFTV